MSEKIKNNWYKILELEYYPNPVEDEDVIRDRIEDKKAFWAKKRNDFSKGKEYTKYLELENKKVIEEEMLDPENNKRKEMIRELQNILFKAVDDMLEFCEGEYISSKVVKEFSKQEGLDEKLIKIRLKEKGKRIEEYRNPIYESYCENLKKKITNYDNSKKNLDLLGKKNLYDFLNSEGIYCQSETDTEKILEKIEERRKKLVKSDAETSAKKELLSECHLIFKNAQKKREYDEYVEHLKYLEVSKELEKLKILSENSDFLNLSNRSFKYLKKIEEILRNKEEAKSIFVGFCRAERIPYDIQENQKNQSQNQNQNQSKKENERKNHSSTGSQSQQRKTSQNQNNNGNNRNSDNRSSNNRNNNNNWKSDTKKKKSSGAAFVWIIVAMLTIVIAVLAISKKDNQRQENRSQNVQQDISQKQTTNNTPKEEVSKEVSKEPEQTKEIPEKTDEEIGKEYFDRGMSEYGKGNLSNAINLLKNAVHYKYGKAMYNLGKIYEDMGNYSEAKNWYKDASDRGDKNSMFRLAFIYQTKDGNLEEAKNYYQKFIDEGSTNNSYFYFAKNNLGNIFYSENEIEKAKELYEDAINGNNPMGKVGLGNIYYYKYGDQSEAKKLYEEAINEGNDEVKRIAQQQYNKLFPENQ